jgi:transcriptional regulator with XRE-family HTH domain
MDEYRQQFGLQLRDARKAAHLSLATVSERVDIGIKHLGEIELGKAWPSMEVTIKLALAIGVSASVFFEGRPSGTEPDVIRNDIVRLLENRNAKQLHVVFRAVQAILSHPL